MGDTWNGKSSEKGRKDDQNCISQISWILRQDSKEAYGGVLQEHVWHGDVEEWIIFTLGTRVSRQTVIVETSSKPTKRGGSSQSRESTCETICQRMLWMPKHGFIGELMVCY